MLQVTDACCMSCHVRSGDPSMFEIIIQRCRRALFRTFGNSKHLSGLLPLQELALALRRRGLRVNLRPLADVRALFWVPVALFALYLSLKLLGVLWWLATSMPQQAVSAAEQTAHQAAARRHHSLST